MPEFYIQLKVTIDEENIGEKYPNYADSYGVNKKGLPKKKGLRRFADSIAEDVITTANHLQAHGYRVERTALHHQDERSEYFWEQVEDFKKFVGDQLKQFPDDADFWTQFDEKTDIHIEENDDDPSLLDVFLYRMKKNGETDTSTWVQLDY